MRRRARLAVTAVATACLAAAGLTAAGGGALAARPHQAAPSRTRSVATITLVTGDRVRVVTRADGHQDATLVPDQTDRRPGGYTLRKGEDVYIVPFEALPYLRAGRLDPALFDVTRLLADGFGDQHARALRLLITAPSSPLTTSAKSASTTPAAPPNSTPTARVPSLGLTGVTVDKARARAFWDGIDAAAPTAGAATSARASAAASAADPQFGHGVGKLWLDRKVRASLDRSVPQIGAPAAYAKGFDGKGTTVGIVDTGIDNENVDLAGKVTAEKNFTAEDSTDDLFGHGTHVASIVAGSGARSAGKYVGVAPGARLLDARVLDSSGSGDESGVMAGMEWAAQQGAQVINMSLGGWPTDGTDPMSQAVNTFTAQYGSLFVIAAGNSGADETVNTPGAADAALTVGAVDRDDVLADFSSRGPRVGDGAIKPEITAPGVEIVAAQADGTELGPVVAPGYVALSGTSMATPHVAGAAALLVQQNPTWTPAQLKADLVATAKPSAATPVWHQGVGRVDVASAIATNGFAVDSGTLNLGFFAWPQGKHPVVTKKVTYTNHGSAATTVSLAATVTNDEGTAVPGAALSFSPASLDLAAGASGSVTVTLDPSKAGVGRWGGLLMATTTGGVTLRTAVGFINETEHYNVTVEVLDRAGQPITEPDVQLFNPQTGVYVSSWDLPDPSRPVFRIEPGVWSVSSVSFAGTMTAPEATLALRPEITIKGEATVTLDGRTARLAGLSVTDRGVTSAASSIGYLRSGDSGAAGVGLSTFSEIAYYVTPTAAVKTGTLTFSLFGTLRVPELTARLVAPSTTLHAMSMWSDDRLDGKRTLPVVAASGKVSGAVALLPMDGESSIDDEVTSLAKAGATAVLAYDANPDAFGWLDAKPAIPVIWVPTDEGTAIKDLLGKGSVKVELVGQYYTPRIYDLSKEWQGRIPGRATARYAQADLARIDESYRSQGGPGTASEVQFPFSELGGWFISLPVKVSSGRTTYLSPDSPWDQMLDYGSYLDPELGFALPVVEWEQPYTQYTAGNRARVTWLEQVVRPAQPASDLFGLTGRSGDDVGAYLSPWTDGAGRVSWLWMSDNGSWQLSAGGRTVAEGNGSQVNATLPAGRQRYTLDYTNRMVADPTWRRSTSTHTTWTFPSAHVDPQSSQPLPLLSIDAALPLDRTNTARAAASMTFPVSGRMPAGVEPVTVTSLAVEISADGGYTWTPAGKVTRADRDTFTVTLTNPATAGDVALRVTAKAKGGISVQQEVMAAYAVR